MRRHGRTRPLFPLLLALVLSGSNAWAMQAAAATGATATPQLDLNDLKAPSSPAFVLLGVEPTSVEKPQTPKAFIFDVLSTLEESEGIPKDYAISLAPFWLKDHPELTFGEYFSKNPGKNFLHTLTLSLASHRPEEVEGGSGVSADIEDPAVGVGFRGMLIGGHAPREQAAAVQALEAASSALLDCLINNDDQPDLCKTQADENRKATATVQEIEVNQRVGFTLDVAGGAVWDFPEERFNERRLRRWGFWATPAYRFDSSGSSSLDALAVLRYLRDKEEANSGDTFDLGGRLIWHINQDLALSAEYVRRRNEGSAGDASDSTKRMVGLIEYRLNEKLFLVASYGEDFATDTEDAGALVSTLGLKVGLGKEEKLLAK